MTFSEKQPDCLDKQAPHCIHSRQPHMEVPTIIRPGDFSARILGGRVPIFLEIGTIRFIPDLGQQIWRTWEVDQVVCIRMIR
jgi:hypothetical protein